MELSSKKALAEWMGYHFIQNSHPERFFEQTGEHAYIQMGNLDSWNPDTDHKQFAEVWNKLSELQQEQALWYMPQDEEPVDRVLNNLPKVMDAVLEVLEIK